MTIENRKAIVVYGELKTWKTESLATLPLGSRLRVIDTERRASALPRRWKKNGHPEKDLEIVQVRDGSPIEMFNQLKTLFKRAPEGFDFHAIDTYTTVGLMLTHALVGVGDRNYNLSTNADLSAYVTDFYWEFAMSVGAQDAWLITIFHEKEYAKSDGLSDPNDWRSKKMLLGPACATSARTTIPGMCDFVFRQELHREVIGGKSKTVAKWRTRGAPLIIASATGYDDVLEDLEDADYGALLGKCSLWRKKPERPLTRFQNELRQSLKAVEKKK